MARTPERLKKFVPWQGAPKKHGAKRNSGEADVYSGDFRGWESARAMGEWTYSRTWAGHYVSVTETPDPPRSGLYRYRVFIDDKRLGSKDFREVKQVFAAVKKAIGPLRRNPSAREPAPRVKRGARYVTNKVSPATLKKAATAIRTGKLDASTVSEIAAAVKVPKGASLATIAKKVNAVAEQITLATATSIGVPAPLAKIGIRVSTAARDAQVGAVKAAGRGVLRAGKWAAKKVRGKKNPVWSRAYINKLPDSAFLLIERGGYKDETGRTTPRSLRHLPVRDMQGRVSEAHAKNALSRAPQLKVAGLTPKIIKALQDKARKLLFFGEAQTGVTALKRPLPKARAPMSIAANSGKIARHMWVISKDSTGKYIVTIGDPRLGSSTLKRRFQTAADLRDWVKYDMRDVVSPTHVHDATGLGLLKKNGKKNPTVTGQLRKLGGFTYDGRYWLVAERPRNHKLLYRADDSSADVWHSVEAALNEHGVDRAFRKLLAQHAGVKFYELRPGASASVRRAKKAVTGQLRKLGGFTYDGRYWLVAERPRNHKLLYRADDSSADVWHSVEAALNEHGVDRAFRKLLAQHAGVKFYELRPGASASVRRAKKAPARRAPVKKGAKRNTSPAKRPSPTKAQLAVLAREFRKARKVAAKYDPRAALAKCVVNSTVHTSPRAFAMTHVSPRKIEVHLAPELALESLAVIRGVIRHEHGHMIAALTKTRAPVKPPTSKAYDAIERHADKIAEKVFKTKIYYDKRGVETTSSTGTRPRPAGLR